MDIFKDYARKYKESVWTPFLNMLNRPDAFIVNQVRTAQPVYMLMSANIMTTTEIEFTDLFWNHTNILMLCINLVCINNIMHL